MKWFFSKTGNRIDAEAPDGTKYAVPDGKMDSYLGNVLLNAMVKALANPPNAHQPTEVPLLTDEEVAHIRKRNQAHNAFARAIEQAVREKAELR